MRLNPLGLALLLVGQSFAEPTVSVLGIETQGVASSLGRALTESLRNTVAQQGFRLLPGKDLVELKLVFCASEETPDCLAKGGKTLGAEKLLYGRISSKDGQVIASLKALDVERATIDQAFEVELAAADASAESLAQRAPNWAKKLLGRKTGATLKMKVEPAGAQVLVDGKVMGTMGTWSLLLEGIEPGQRVVEAKLSGFQPWLDIVLVKEGDTTELTVQLVKGVLRPSLSELSESPITVRKDEDESTGQSAWQLAAWIGLSATAALGATAIWAGLSLDDLEQEKEDAIVASRARLASDQPGYINAAAGDDACAEAELEGAIDVSDVCDRGRSRAALANVLIGLTAGSAVVTGFFFWRGYVGATATAEGTTVVLGGHF